MRQATLVCENRDFAMDRIVRMGINVGHNDDPDRMSCDLCGAVSPFDEALPYLNQTASFATDHGCTWPLLDLPRSGTAATTAELPLTTEQWPADHRAGSDVAVIFDTAVMVITFTCRRCWASATDVDLSQQALSERIQAFLTVHGTCRSPR